MIASEAAAFIAAKRLEFESKFRESVSIQPLELSRVDTGLHSGSKPEIQTQDQRNHGLL